MKVGEIARRFTEDQKITEEQVLAEAERLAKPRSFKSARGSEHAKMTDLLRLWRDAQRVAWRPGDPVVLELRPNGIDAGHIRTLERTMPPGTLPYVLALLGMRWDSFRVYLARTRKWEVGRAALGVAVTRMDAVAEWVHQQRDTNPEVVTETVEQRVDRLRAERDKVVASSEPEDDEGGPGAW